jgi:transcription termination/antitermination protein NusG
MNQVGLGVDSAFPDSSLGSWIVLRTKSRQEKILAADLAAAGVGCFLPLVNCTRFYAGRKAVVEIPLFPGYVFLRGSLDDAYEADRKKRVAQIISVHDQRQIDEELTNLHLALCVNSSLNPYPYLKRGVRVVVRSGPLRGVRGSIEEITRRDRLILQVQMLGQATSLEIEGSLLDVEGDESPGVRSHGSGRMGSIAL